MKTLRCHLKDGLCLVLSLAVLTGWTRASAQTTGSNLIPVVTVQATQPMGTAANPGVFTVFRAGNTNAPLNVWYDLGGTASNGVDYAMIPPHLVAIAAGATSNTIVIQPLAGPPSGAAKTVVLTLTNSPLETPVNYEIGSPSGAVVFIETGGATNLPPVVEIVSPTNGQVFVLPPTNSASPVVPVIPIFATASDPDGSVTNVEFFAGTNDLGAGAMAVLDPPGVNGVTGPIWNFQWLNVPPGNYPLTAVATDNGGASTTSRAVNITVLQSPPTNPPPIVRIISPANGATFFAPVNIPLYAYAADPNGPVESVQFFDGTNSLGFGQPVPPPVAGTVPPVYPTNIFFLIWSNAPVGKHVLTAQATIVFTGHPLVLVAVSDPVDITVLPSPPPPTNRPPIVSIVASDPVAIEGTNCRVWLGETNATPTWAAWPAAVCRFFTNWGPKTATFTVSRFGDTNDDLTVPYDIGGTASNGVDYVTLPGFVTIPAGERRAPITIVPIDDGPPDVNTTVILALTPSTNLPPEYLPGFPRRAAAIIIDRAGPSPATAMLPGQCFHLAAPGPDAAWYGIEYSTNLTDWTAVCTNQVINGSIDFVDPDVTGNQSRFYRPVPLANPPSE
jgi:hypothetical protein